MKAYWWVVGILSEGLFTVLWLVAAAWQDPGYRPVRDDISDMGALTAPHAFCYLIPQAVLGAASIAFALFGLWPALRPAGAVGTAAAWFVALSAVQNISDAFFRLDCRAADGCDQARATASWHGSLHATTGLVCVLLLIGSPFLLARAFRKLPAWQGWVGPFRWIGVVMVAGLIGVALPQTASIHGLLQRAVALIGAALGIALALRLRGLADRHGEVQASRRVWDGATP